MTDVNRLVRIGLAASVVLLAALAAWMYLYGRPKARLHQVLVAFQGEPTAEQREQTLDILRRRIAAMAPPSWNAAVQPSADGMLLLTYRTAHGPGELAESILQRGVCSFHFFEPSRTRIEAARETGPPEGYELVNYLETYRDYDRGTNDIVRRKYPVLVESKPVLAPESFRGVRFWTEGIGKFTHIRFQFEPGDAARLAAASRERPRAFLAVVVDGVVRIGTELQGELTGDELEIHGLLDNEEMEKLVKVIRTRALPCELRVAGRTSSELR